MILCTQNLRARLIIYPKTLTPKHKTLLNSQISSKTSYYKNVFRVFTSLLKASGGRNLPDSDRLVGVLWPAVVEAT